MNSFFICQSSFQSYNVPLVGLPTDRNINFFTSFFLPAKNAEIDRSAPNLDYVLIGRQGIKKLRVYSA